MKCYHIDSATRTVTEAEWSNLKDLQRLVDGFITDVKRWPEGSILFVDEDALLKPQEHFFIIEGVYHPLAGDGVVLGPQWGDDEEDDDDEDVPPEHGAPEITLDQLRQEVRFLNRDQFDAWGRANASDPSLTITTKEGTFVLDHYGDMVKRVPRKEK